MSERYVEGQGGVVPLWPHRRMEWLDRIPYSRPGVGHAVEPASRAPLMGHMTPPGPVMGGKGRVVLVAAAPRRDLGER